MLTQGPRESRGLRERDALVERVADEERRIRVIHVEQWKGPHRRWAGFTTHGPTWQRSRGRKFASSLPSPVTLARPPSSATAATREPVPRAASCELRLPVPSMPGRAAWSQPADPPSASIYRALRYRAGRCGIRNDDTRTPLAHGGAHIVESGRERMLRMQTVPRREGHETRGGDPSADTPPADIGRVARPPAAAVDRDSRRQRWRDRSSLVGRATGRRA